MVNVPAVPAAKVAVDPLVKAGAWTTVSVAAVVVADREISVTLVKTARYSLPFSPAFAVTESAEFVAPPMLVNVVPPSVDRCHCTVGAGNPLAAALKVAVAPAFTVRSLGLAVMTGARWTVIGTVKLTLSKLATT